MSATPAPNLPEQPPSASRRLLLPLLLVALLVGLAAGGTAGYAVGSNSEADSHDVTAEGEVTAEGYARSACEALHRWGGKDAPSRLEEQGIEGHWLSLSVVGYAGAAGVADGQFDRLAELGRDIMAAVQRMQVEQLEEPVDAMLTECEQLDV